MSRPSASPGRIGPQPASSEYNVRDYVNIAKSAVASARDAEGKVLFPREWDDDFLDAPEIDEQKQPTVDREEMEAILRESQEPYLTSWVFVQRHNETLVAQTAVLDLRSHSVSRSPEPNPGEQPLELRRGFSQLNIYLPLGSPEGAYEVRIVTASGDSLLNTGGPARLSDGITTLHVREDAFIARPGQYTLQIRRAPSDWNSYPLVLR